jgi:hypothetical protein
MTKSADRIGWGIDELGGILMRAFLHTLNEYDIAETLLGAGKVVAP